MNHRIQIESVTFAAASFAEQRTGLLGFVSCIANGALVLDSIAVRRTRDGRLALSFPSRRDRHGVDHPLFRPLDSASRAEIEEQIFARLPGRSSPVTV